MTRSKRSAMALCAVVIGVMAMSAGSAQATLSWLVLNSSGTTATELKAELVGEQDSPDLTLLAKTLGIKIIFTCSSFSLKGMNLEVGGKLTTGGKAVLTGCEAYKEGTLAFPLSCGLHTSGTAAGTIETTELKGELVLHELITGGKEVLTRIEPKTAGGPITTVLTNGVCALPDSNKISGVIYFKDCEKKALTHEVKHLIEQGPLTSLIYGGHSTEHLETSLDGSIWVKLGGAHASLKWAAMDV